MGHRLLLADDSITIQKVIELTFADEKIEVVAVSDGDQAIARLASERFDVVLADIGMPIKDGFEVAAFMKRHPGLEHVPVILLTGAFDPVDDTRVSAVGAAAVLAKPFEPHVLVSRVRDLLRSAKTPVQPPRTSGATEPAGPRLIAPLPTAEASSSSVDEYFDRLDKAFASLNVPLEPRELTRSFPRAVPPPEHDPENPEAAPDLEVEAPDPANPLAVATPDPAGNAHEIGRTEANGGVEAIGGAEAPPPQESPLAKKFATLLAVEQGELPASALEPVPDRGDDPLVDRIVRRVVEQMSDRAVRDLATEIVSRTAERLVREEIDRIKSGV
jgi:DNA-binding response OmpR family regulator